jgi:hypothetical protein
MRRLVLLLASVGAMLALYVGAASAQAAPGETLDANDLASGPSSANSVWGNFYNGQTFTAEHDGALTSVEVFLAVEGSPGALTVQIANIDAASGLPTVPEDVLATTTLPQSEVPQTWDPSNPTSSLQIEKITFDTPASVVAGKKYALILKLVDETQNFNNAYIIGAGPGGPNNPTDIYTGGDRIWRYNELGSSWVTDPVPFNNFDLIFGTYLTTRETTAPNLSVSHTGANANGWNNTSPVTLNVSASDSGSGLSAEGPTCMDGNNALSLTAGSTADTWTASVSGEGLHAIECSVSDKAGNTTNASDTVKIDTKAPSVTCSVSPSTLRPANNHKLVTVTASVQVTDNTGGSGTDPNVADNRFNLLSVSSNQPDSGLAADDVPSDIQGWDTTGKADTSGQLRAERYGRDRIYTLTYLGKDLAGNTTGNSPNCEATVTVRKGG